MALELADIFRQYGPVYRQKYASCMPATHFKAMRAIEQCRTEALGGQVYRCPNCEQIQYSYHSCRNRHCPKCQNENAQRWLDKQHDLLLPVPYFLLTFTLPASFNQVARSHQRLLYDLLFKTSAAATQQLAQDPRWIGGQVGMVGVLHTWGRNLAYHPHLHYLVPGGGLSTDGQSWLPARHNFLLPVRALSRVFRSKLQQALHRTDCYPQIPATVWQQDWVVHCEEVGSGLSALKYLAPYIFRVALSNNRLLQLENDRVTFRYRATETGTEKRCTLGAEEFIHRFLQHVLPKGFVKVRYYGFFAATRRARLASGRQYLSTLTAPSPSHRPTRPQPSPKSCVPNAASPCSCSIPWLPFFVVLHEPSACPSLAPDHFDRGARLSVCSDSCFFPDDLILHHFICKKIPFPCTMILLFGGLATGLGLPSRDLRFNFQPVCGFGRAA